MEKGPSTFAQYWTSEYNEMKHFLEHGWQMGFEYDVEGFSNAAKTLATSDDENTCSFKRKDECTCKFNKSTRHFIVLNREGKIITFYKADFDSFKKEWINKGLYKIKGDF